MDILLKMIKSREDNRDNLWGMLRGSADRENSSEVDRILLDIRKHNIEISTLQILVIDLANKAKEKV